jgi:hypothetical protein
MDQGLDADGEFQDIQQVYRSVDTNQRLTQQLLIYCQILIFSILWNRIIRARVGLRSKTCSVDLHSGLAIPFPFGLSSDTFFVDRSLSST